MDAGLWYVVAFSLATGVMIPAFWILLLITRQIRELRKGRRDIWFHIVAEIATVLRREPRAHWMALFAQARIPAGPISRLDEVVRDPTLGARGLFYTARRGETPVPQVGLGIHFDGNANTFRELPPLLGEDTREVFRSWLGWTDRQVDDLDGTGALRPAARERDT